MPLNAVWRRRVLGLGVLACLGTVGCSFRTMESGVGAAGSGGGNVAGTAGSGVGGSGGTNVGTGTGGAAGTAAAECNPCSDFPGTPIIDMPTGGTTPPADVGTTFGPAGSGAATGGPCLTDPEPGSLFPKNWLPPRVVLDAGA